MIKLLIESGSSKVFDLQNPGNYVEEYMPWYKVGRVSGHDYQKFEKRRDGKITYMTCEDYINHCINDIFTKGYNSVVTNAVDFNRVHEYAEDMKNGDTFPVPYLNYSTHQQEGRHRAFAYAEAFGKDAKFPVLEIFEVRPQDVSNDEIYEYAEQKTNGHNTSGMFEYVMTIQGRTEKDICEYLGVPYETEYDDIDEEELNDAVADAVAQEMTLDDLENDPDIINYDEEIKTLCQLSGKSLEEINNMDAFQFMKLVDKYLQ